MKFFVFCLIGIGIMLAFTIKKKEPPRPFLPPDLETLTFSIRYKAFNDGWTMTVFEKTDPKETLLIEQNVFLAQPAEKK